METIHIALSGVWLQDPDSLSSGNSKLLMFFVAMVAAAMVAQAIALIIMAIGAGKARKRGLEIAEELRSKMLPIITDTHELIRENTPKIKVITDNFVHASHVVRAKAQEFDVTAGDLNAKTRAQADRVNGMVTSVLDTSAEIADTIHRGIRIPVREVSGLVNGLKAGLDVLVGRAKSFGNGRGNLPRDPGQGW
jgi:methyl-accepting chemotaxis protein